MRPSTADLRRFKPVNIAQINEAKYQYMKSDDEGEDEDDADAGVTKGDKKSQQKNGFV